LRNRSKYYYFAIGEKHFAEEMAMPLQATWSVVLIAVPEAGCFAEHAFTVVIEPELTVISETMLEKFTAGNSWQSRAFGNVVV
jgi:hypothetical protein